MSRDPATPPQHPPEPIAIVGVGCRFPGARGPAEFWDLLKEGRCAVRDAPQHRVELGYDIDRFYDPRPGTPGKISSKKAGFVDHPELFDPIPFGLSPRDAAAMEPQQRLMVEVVWDALEDAGIPADSIQGERVAVMLGYMAEDYSREKIAVHGEDYYAEGFDVFGAAGISSAVLTGRISFLLGVTGPTFSLDTACSSSLLTAHLACQSLWSGESKLALAGGVNIFLTPEGTLGLSRSGMLANDGKCKAFDAKADGFVRAEGAGVVLLRPLSDALADGNPVYAVIRGTGFSSDGRDGGHMMAPGRGGQAQAMRDAYAQSGIEPADVHYVETHGTGTVIGDPIEIGALADVMGPGRSPDRPLLVASVKGNIGHAESASGVAGLIKTALSIHHRELPAQLHFEEPSPHIAWDEAPIEVNAKHIAWPYPERPLAGINSFGISGTNAHMVLEAAPERASEPVDVGRQGLRLYPVSAVGTAALAERVRGLSEHVRHLAPEALPDLAYTLARRRQHRSDRLAVVAGSPSELATELAACLGESGELVADVAARAGETAPEAVFVFPGQGGQWPGMGRVLLEREPVFRAAIEEWDAHLRVHVDWSLVDVLRSDAADTFDSAAVLQPTLVALEVALADLWQSVGVRPSRVVGQSLGEIAAAITAGALDRASGALVACVRGELVDRVAGQGAMGVVGLSAGEAERAIAPWRGAIEVSGTNDPNTTTVSGDAEAVSDCLERLDADGTFARPLNVDFASHCFHMVPLCDEFEREIDSIRPVDSGLPIHSTVTGGEIAGSALDAAYWARNLRSPVRFSETVAEVLTGGPVLFVEVSPHPTAARSIEATAQAAGVPSACVPSLRRGADDQRALLGSLGALYARGLAVDFERLYPAGRVVSTPLYPYQREVYWFSDRRRSDLDTPRHPLLGRRVASSLESGRHYFECVLWPDSVGLPTGVSGPASAALPPSSLIDVALAAVAEVWPAARVELRGTALPEPLLIPDADDAANPCRALQVVVEARGDTGGTVRVASRAAVGGPGGEPGDDAGAPVWRVHLTAAFANRAARSDGGGRSGSEAIALARGRCTAAVEAETFYTDLELGGLGYRRRVRSVEGIGRGDGELVARVAVPTGAPGMTESAGLHPVILEAGVQLAAWLAGTDRPGPPPVLPRTRGVDRVVCTKSGVDAVWCHVQMQPDGSLSVVFETEGGERAGVLDGLRFDALGLPAERWAYRSVWREADLARASAVAPVRWLVLAGRDRASGEVVDALRKSGADCQVVRPGAGFGPVEGGYEIDPRDRGDVDRLLDAAVPREEDVRLRVALLPGMYDASSRAGRSRGRELSALCIALVEGLAAGPSADRAELAIVTRGLHAIAPGDPEPSADEAAESGTLWRTAQRLAADVNAPPVVCIDAEARPRGGSAGELVAALSAADAEPERALRGDRLLVPRLVPMTAEESAEAASAPAQDRPFRARVFTPDTIRGTGLQEVRRRDPAAGEIEIEVRAAGLGLLDALTALGARNASLDSLGRECAGVVAAVGDGVTDLQVGDRVYGFARGALATHAIAPRSTVAPLPTVLDFADAAALPFACATAVRALDAASLDVGDRLFIEKADCGVGLVALQLARARGADVFATAASPPGRRLVERLGARVCDAADSEAIVELGRIAGDGGIDVVLAAAGRVVSDAIVCRLAPTGRWVEFTEDSAARSATNTASTTLGPNQVRVAVDLGAWIDAAAPVAPGDAPRRARRPVADWLGSAADAIEAGDLRPLPCDVFPVAEVDRAVRYTAQARPLASVVVDFGARAQTPIRRAHGGGQLDDAVALVVGDGDALAAATAVRLFEAGAREIVWAHRSALAPDVSPVLAELSEQGATVTSVAWDPLRDNPAAVDGALAGADGVLRAVVHLSAAGDAADAIDRDFADVRTVECLEAWTDGVPVDVFALVTVDGSGDPVGALPGANPFFDAVARSRRARGLAGVHIVWGARRPVAAPAGSGLEALGELAASGAPVTWLLPATPEQWSAVERSFDPRLSELATQSGNGPGEGGAARAILALPAAERIGQVQQLVADRLARVLALSSADRERLDPEAPFDRHGLDSLMGLELHLALETDLGLELPRTLLMDAPSVRSVSETIHKLLEPEG